MFIADKPLAPPDVRLDKPIVVQTTHGQVFISSVFTVEQHQPMPGFVKIYDSPNDKTYWFNMQEIVWIGPRS
jgi:hypothetical protein